MSFQLKPPAELARIFGKMMFPEKERASINVHRQEGAHDDRGTTKKIISPKKSELGVQM